MVDYPHQTLFSLPFFNGKLADATQFIWQKILDNEFVAVATPNPEQIVQKQHDKQFAMALESFDVFLPDGQGIIWASKKKHPLKGRVAGVDVVAFLVEKMNKAGVRGLIIGGEGYDTFVHSGELSHDEQNVVRSIDSKAREIYQQKEAKIASKDSPERLKKCPPCRGD
jgi:UDP-N-acetyl-D-mannosaminuronic acid transferase (WecB/TagA/CpsF family)